MTPEQLVELEAIKRLKYRYMRCVDRKLWDEIVECFIGDATCSYSDGKYSHQGRDAIVRFLRDSMGADSFHSSHRVHHPEITLTGERTATGIWALEDVVIETKWQVTIRGAAFYEDEYVKQDGHWKIRHTGYKRTFEEIQPRHNVEGLSLTASAWGTGVQAELPIPTDSRD
jgi:hypothetical protein